MKKILYIIIGISLFPMITNAQSISGKSPKYKMEIYSKRGADFKKCVDANTTTAFEQFLAKGYSNNRMNNQATEKLFKLVNQTNTIAAYEDFLSKRYGISKLNNQAIANIYTLTAQMDAVEGYRFFLKKHPNAPDAAKATARLYEIMYAIAEEENDIASYYGFLVQFPKSQKLLREKAYINMQMLEVEKAADEFNEKKKEDDDHELKERIARQLYIEAIRAKEGNDQYTFMRKYNTVLYSEIFKDTQAAFDLFRDKELSKLIKELRDEIRQNTYAVNSMKSAITSKLNEILGGINNISGNLNDIQNSISQLESTVMSSQNDYTYYFERMIDIQREQSNDWSEYVNTGRAPTEGSSYWFSRPKRY